MIKKISIDQLKPGMYVTDANNQWIPEGNRARRGFVKSAETIAKIRQLGVKELFIDTELGEDCPEASEVTLENQLQEEQQKAIRKQSGIDSAKAVSLGQEREKAGKIHSQAKQLIGGVLDDVKKGKGVDVTEVNALADEMIGSLDRNLNALACLTRIREKDNYLLEHSVNVGVLLGVFARSRNIDGPVIKELVTGGLLHDIGKILVPDQVLNKPGKLTDAEWEEMKRHVTYGEQVLDTTEGLSDLSRSICAQHHERLDGSGYPRNLPAEKISVYGRMSAIVDVYDAITADRVYHDGMSTNEALKKLIEWSVFHLDKQLVYDFIRCVSVYPVGTVVELDNRRVGVVIQSNHAEPKSPMVRVFFNLKHGHHIEPQVIDLAAQKNQRYIVGALDAREIGINEMDFL